MALTTERGGMDTQAILNDPAKMKSYVDAALARGVSQAHINSFLQSDPGDYGRRNE